MAAVDLENLRNGIDRNNHTYGPDDFGAWIPMGKPVTYTLPEPTVLREIRVVFDSDLERVTVPGGECEQLHSMQLQCGTRFPANAPAHDIAQRILCGSTNASRVGNRVSHRLQFPTLPASEIRYETRERRAPHGAETLVYRCF